MTKPRVKACFDESGDPERNDFFVVAGLIGTNSQWRRLYPRWRAALRADPPITYFKMSEAHAARGEFRGWSKRAREQKTRLFGKVIRDSGLMPLVTSIPLAEFRYVMRRSPLEGDYASPFIPAFFLSICRVADRMEKYGGKQHKPLIVFDSTDRSALKRVCEMLFEDLKSASPSEPLFHQSGRWLEGLEFKDDREEELGLQAADYAAWHWRTIWWEINRTGKASKAHVRAAPPGEQIHTSFGGNALFEWQWALRKYLGNKGILRPRRDGRSDHGAKDEDARRPT